jgi:hypothetical protein
MVAFFALKYTGGRPTFYFFGIFKLPKKIFMKRLSFLIALIPVFSFSQRVIDVRKDNANPVRDGLFYVVGGVPFSPAKYVEVVSGTPYFNEDYLPADLLMSGGGEHRNIPVKIDLVSNELVYKDSLGNELVATSSIRQVVLHNKSAGKDFVFINSALVNFNGHEPPAGWYQLIESGDASLYKKIQKTINETKPYNSATTEQTIQTTNKYFVDAFSTFTEVKKPKELAELLADKSKEMESYIASNKINSKEDDGWQKAIAYYNSLHSK